VEEVVRRFAHRAAPCAWPRTHRPRSMRNRRRGGTTRRVTRAGPSRSSDPSDPEPVAPRGRR
jgi:hypothetical protein